MLDCFVSGLVSLSPPMMVQVCRGDQVELNCTVAGVVLTWSFSENGTHAERLPRNVYIQNLGELQSQQLNTNSVHFNFSRLSASDILPMVSKLTISPVDASFDGVEVTCTNPGSTESSSTVIRVRKEVVPHGKITETIQCA